MVGTPMPLNGPIEVETSAGQVFRVQPGPSGRGLLVVPVQAAPPQPPKKRATTGRGRPPRPSTLKLRERLAEDAKAGTLREPGYYVKLARRWDPQAGAATLRQIVYREHRAAAEAQGAKSAR